MNATPARLNLGCGTTSAPGWVNVDGSWSAWLSRHRAIRSVLVRCGVVPARAGDGDWPDDVVVRDLRKSLPFSSESFDAIYASHVVEHLYRTEAAGLLAECRRILKPGGLLRVVVPDLKAIVDEYVAAGGNGHGPTTPTDPCARLNSRLMLRQGSPPSGPLHLRLYSFFSDFHSHKWMYDATHLAGLFRDAGFADAAPRGYLDSGIPGIAEVERASRVLDGEGIVIEGTRA